MIKFDTKIIESRWVSPTLDLLLYCSTIYASIIIENYYTSEEKVNFGEINAIIVFLCIGLAVFKFVLRVCEVKYKESRGLIEGRLKTINDKYSKVNSLAVRQGRNIQNSIDSLLENLGKELSFEEQDLKIDRITLFAYQKSTNSFFVLSRWSLNTRYAQINSLKQYPVDKGCIGKAWEHGWWFDNSLNLDTNDYNQYQLNTYGLSLEEVAAMSMRSNMYATLRIRNKVFLGILAIESINHDRFEEPRIKEQMTPIANLLGYLVYHLNGISTLAKNEASIEG